MSLIKHITPKVCSPGLSKVSTDTWVFFYLKNRFSSNFCKLMIPSVRGSEKRVLKAFQQLLQK